MLKLMQPLVTVAVLIGPVAEAAAQPMFCAKRETLVTALAERYKEERRSIGLASGDLLTEVFVSGSGSWTILVTTKAGLACILATGKRWNGVTPAAADGPDV